MTAADPRSETEIYQPAAEADADAIRHLIEAAHRAHADQIAETDSSARAEEHTVPREIVLPEVSPTSDILPPATGPDADTVSLSAVEAQTLPEPTILLPPPVSESKMQTSHTEALLYEARARAAFEEAEPEADRSQVIVFAEAPDQIAIHEPGFPEPEPVESRVAEGHVISWAPEDLDFLKTLLPDNAEPADEEALLLASHPDYTDEMFLTEGEAETAAEPAEEQDLAFLLQSLEPEQAVTVQPMLRTIRQMAEDIQQLPEADETERLVMEQTLQQWCGRLLEQLGMDSDEETVRRFTHLLLNREIADAPESPDESLSANELNRRGTREYKPFDGLGALGKLARDIKQMLHLPLWLGRYTLRAATV